MKRGSKRIIKSYFGMDGSRFTWKAESAWAGDGSRFAWKIIMQGDFGSS